MREDKRLYHSHLGLFQFQIEGVVYCYEREDNLAVWDTGLGKALRNDQRVMTPTGWVKIAEVEVGDEVIGQDGLPHRVIGVYPQGVRQLWEVTFGDGAKAICDADHLWQVQYWGSDRSSGKQGRVRRSKVMTLNEIMQEDRARAYSVPLIDPVQFSEISVPVEPYTLGVFIGDGGLTQSSPRLTSGDHEIVSYLDLPSEIKIREVMRGGAWQWRFVTDRGQPNPLLDALRWLGVCVKSEQKRIPDLYLRGSVEQRWALLQGLMDTDGYCGASLEYATSSPGLADDVAELVRSLGGTAQVSVKKTTHLNSYTVRFVIEGCPFRLTRKQEQWRPRRGPYRPISSIVQVEDGEATCIRVEGGLFVTEGYVVTHNSHLAMATSAMLFEDDLIDHMLLVCEKNKLDPNEWPGDLAKYTELDFVVYQGTPAKRQKLLAEGHQVYVGTYETFRNDIAKLIRVEGRKTKKLVPSFFTEAMKGKRVFVVYDEMTKLGNRGSQLHKNHDLMVQTLRKNGATRVLGLTATPIERSPENLYNLGRVLMPDHVGTVAQFERDHVTYRDVFGNARKFKNLHPDETEAGVLSFSDRMKPILLRKRKTDDDVRDQFPKTMEEFIHVDLDPIQRNFYKALVDTFDDSEMALFLLLRQVVAHPQALLKGEGKMAKAVVEHVGEDVIRAMPSAKAQRLVEHLEPLVVGQGAQVVVFSFFGPSVLPIIGQELEKKGMRVAMNHGKMADKDRAKQKEEFRAGERRVFLTSDSGARGINLPEALYVIEYEMALTHANRTQRLNRIHRIDSEHDSVTFQTMIARNTIEEGIVKLVMERHEWMDKLLDDDDPGNHITADMRRSMIRMARAS